MASNPQWCLSGDEWRRLSRLAQDPQPEACSIRASSSTCVPSTGRSRWPTTCVSGCSRGPPSYPIFMRAMVENTMNWESPLNWWKGFPLRRRQGVSAHHRSEEARLAALRRCVRGSTRWPAQIPDTNTVERLRVSGEQTGMAADELAAMIDAFHHIQRLRLEQSGAAPRCTVSNRVNPDDLHELDRLILKESLKAGPESAEATGSRVSAGLGRCRRRCQSPQAEGLGHRPPCAQRNRRRRCRSCRGRPRAGSTSRHAPEQVAALAAEIAGGHANDHDLAVKRLGPVLQRGVGNDDAESLDIEFAVAERLEEAQPGLGHHRQQQRVVEVPAVVHVADVERDLGRKGETVPAGRSGFSDSNGMDITCRGHGQQALVGPLPGQGAIVLAFPASGCRSV
jgi:hypothetical protein